MKEINFSDKVILIAGATGGMGGEIAKLLSKNRSKLALIARSEDKLKTLYDKLNNNECECIYKICNITNRVDVKEAVEFTFKKYGKIDIAILTAGILVPNPIETFSSNIIKESMEINFFGNLYFIEFLLPIMKNQKSGIIAAVSTLTDKRGHPSWSSYQSSKAALSITMECLRIEAIRYNIDIITVKPGTVKTPMIGNQEGPGIIDPEKAAKIILRGIKKRKKIIEFPLMQVIPTRLSEFLPEEVYDKILLNFD